jgi:hypothetical protein
LQKNYGKLGRLYEPCNFDSFTKTGDIYCLFYEKAIQLSNDGGHVCFITSNKWMRAGYGKKLRDYLVQNSQPVKLLDMGPEVFDAAVDTNILLMRNLAPEAGVTIRATTIKSDFDKQSGDIAQYLHKNGVDMEIPAKGDPWAILSAVDVSMKRKIINQGKPLSEYLEGEIYRGIITGLNEAFVVNRATRDNLILEDSSSAEVLKPFLRGQDVRRWQKNFAEQYLIVIESSENRAHPWSDELAVEAEMIFATRYPAIHAHLAAFRDRLMHRQDQGRFFWELRSCKYWNEFERTKMIYPDIFQHQSFTVDKDMFYCGNTCYFIPTEETWLCGLLNSRAVEWFYSLISNSLGAGGLRAFTEKMRQIPVPDVSPAEKERVSEIVDRTLAEKRENGEADVSALENEIDEIVYSWYDLTCTEIAIVEDAMEETV